MCLFFASSRCQESQREAALLLGQFATTDPDCKVLQMLHFSVHSGLCEVDIPGITVGLDSELVSFTLIVNCSRVVSVTTVLLFCILESKL